MQSYPRKMSCLRKICRLVLLAAPMAVLLSLTAGFGEPGLSQNNPLPADRRPDINSARPAKITVADDHSYAPFAFTDAQGRPAGITIDIWKLWSRKTGIAIDFKLMEWEAALAAVSDGRADVVGGLFRTPEREALFDFSQPFFTVATSIFFHKQIHGIRGLADLQGFTVGVVKDDSAEELIRKNHPTALLAAFAGTEDLVRAAVEGRVKVFVADAEVGRFYLAKHDKDYVFRETNAPIAVNRQHTAVGKNKAALLALVQEGFDRITEKEIRAIVDEWTGRSVLTKIPWAAIGLGGAGISALFGLMFIWNILLKKKITAAMAEVEQRNRQLQDSETRFKALFNLAPFACVLNDMQGRYLMVNQAFCDHYGLTKQAVVGRTNAELGITVDKEAAAAVLAQLERTGSAANVETQLLAPDQKSQTTLFSSRIIELDGNQAILTATVDITALRQAEQAIRASAYRFRTFFDSNPEGIVLLAFDGNVLDANKTFCKMSGYGASELIGRHFTALVPADHDQKALATFSAIRAGLGRDNLLEIPLVHQDGKQLPVSINGWRVTDEKSVPVMIGVFVRDLTQEKKLAQEKTDLEKQLMHIQKIDAIGTLAGGIAHDFNNILGGIIGYTELALMNESPLPANKKFTYLSRVMEAGNRAKELVQQILKFSRREETVMGVVSLGPLIKESVKLLRATLPTTITIDQHITAIPDTISGDPTQIHQVVMNLCTNAYHAMRETGGVLTVSLETVTLDASRKAMGLEVPPGAYLKLSIQDTGRGIAPGILDRIFEPYFTTKQVNEGTGLGLSVTIGIIRGHNGLIEVDSRVGEGSRFDIHFPIASRQAAETPAPAGDLPRGKGQNVLVVDDESFFLDVVRENLHYLGYQVTACQSSMKALETFKQAPEKVDLLVTDQTMPEMTGVQLIAELRKSAATLPIVLCTGYSETVTEQSARHYGISRFLMKPVTIADLAWAVHEALGDDGAV